MDVLAFSTVPAVVPVAPPVVGWEEAFVDPAELVALTGGALRDMAESGLTVTGPSVTLTHPLARLVSRAVVVYRFRRGRDYSARHLVEFVDWAGDLNCVFRIGNGPFRNLDGESLGAPGMAVKVPVHPEARNRRLRNLRSLRLAGYGMNEELPAVVGDSELILRDPVEAVHRLCALSVTAAAAAHVMRGAFPPVDEAAADLELVTPALTPRERGFLDGVGAARRARSGRAGAPVPPPALVAEASTFREEHAAVEALAWSLSLVDAPPSRTRAWDFDADAWAVARSGGLPGEVLATGCALLLARGPGLREPARILEAFDLAHVVHHTIEVGDRLRREPPGWVKGDLRVIAWSWTRALAWLCAPGSGWGQAERLL